jgi:hypothetical protein
MRIQTCRRQLIDRNLEFFFMTYSVDKVLVEMTGLEPVTPCVQGRRSPN